MKNRVLPVKAKGGAAVPDLLYAAGKQLPKSKGKIEGGKPHTWVSPAATVPRTLSGAPFPRCGKKKHSASCERRPKALPLETAAFKKAGEIFTFSEMMPGAQPGVWYRHA